MGLFFNAGKDLKVATQDANALVAHLGLYCAYEEARRRCKDPKFTFQQQPGRWERVTDILAKRAGRSSTSLILSLEIPQEHSRYAAIGQPVEITFSSHPSEVYTGRVEAVLQAAPFRVRIKLDDQDVEDHLPAGRTGVAAVFTERANSRVIRRVMLRQTVSVDYVD